MSYFGVPDIVVTLFAYLHILSAIAWFGAAIFFVSSMAPAMRALSRPGYLEFLATVVPRLTRYFFWAATSTVVFGPALLLTIPDFSPYLGVGIVTGLAAYIAMLLDARTFGKVSRMAKDLLERGEKDALPPEFLRELRMGRIGTVSTVLLLVVTLMFMVYSGYPF